MKYIEVKVAWAIIAMLFTMSLTSVAHASGESLVDLGAPFGKLKLIDEIDVGASEPAHRFAQSPKDAVEVQTLLGKPCRVLRKTPGEGAYMTFRIGQGKSLKAGGSYVLEIEYPEDAPRSMIINNSGNESSIGFYTGAAVGDAFHPKYVNNNIESINTPLSGKFQTWTMFFNLHDRISDTEYVRGKEGNRDLTPADGFTVVISQFAADSLPISKGAAVSRIRLFEVPDLAKIKAQYTLPPNGLPKRHIFWREEMADGVLVADKNGAKPGMIDPIDWYRFKANQMGFLGINTYTKDLLEFGAVQGWDPTPYGGNSWCYFDGKMKNTWSQVVQVMGEHGFDILPYYEYAGSKGKNGLGPQRRAKPLTRDDAFTHIKWIETSNADITDPDTYADFKKMLDLTIVKEMDKAHFVGAWIRPRSQIPMGFGDATRKRFAEEANDGKAVTRQELIADTNLLGKYKQWWFGKRQQFLVAMRDYLREKGVKDAAMLFTACPSEPGVSFATWQPMMVTDDVPLWKQILADSPEEKDKKTEPVSVQDVVSKGLYFQAVTLPAKNWGNWELDHASPESDPQDYKTISGVQMTYSFNRLYTVASPEALDAFRTPSGLALIHHNSLNENMMYDSADKPKLGYFAADIERAGPYCMMAEAVAMANGDPTYIGYLVGRTYVRGFPKYVRNFNTAFLSLPALPSERLEGASSDDKVVVRSIKTDKDGTYLIVVNTDFTDKSNVSVTLPAKGNVTDAATGTAIGAADGKLSLSLYPFELRAIRIQ